MINTNYFRWRLLFSTQKTIQFRWHSDPDYSVKQSAYVCATYARGLMYVRRLNPGISITYCSQGSEGMRMDIIAIMHLSRTHISVRNPVWHALKSKYRWRKQRKKLTFVLFMHLKTQIKYSLIAKTILLAGHMQTYRVYRKDKCILWLNSEFLVEENILNRISNFLRFAFLILRRKTGIKLKPYQLIKFWFKKIMRKKLIVLIAV